MSPAIQKPALASEASEFTKRRPGNPQDTLAAPVSRGGAGLGSALLMRRRLGSARHRCANGRRIVRESPSITTSPPRMRPPPRTHSKRASWVTMVIVFLSSRQGRLLDFYPSQGRLTTLAASRRPMHAASFRNGLMSRRSPRPHIKLLCNLRWCLSTLPPSEWIVGSFHAPCEEEKERICGFSRLGRFGRLFGDIVSASIGTWCTQEIRRRSTSKICWHKVNSWVLDAGALETLSCKQVQYTYPTPPFRYLLS